MEEHKPIDKPVASFRAGAVVAAVWDNKANVNGQPTTILKASVSRRYRDRDGQWRTSQSFSRSEIPLAIHVLQKAFEMMLEKTPEQEIDDAIGNASDDPDSRHSVPGSRR